MHNLFPILLFTAILALTGCFEKKKEEVIETPSTDGGGGGSTTPPPSNNYGYVTLSYPTVSGTYKGGLSFHADTFQPASPTTNIASGAVLTNFTVSPSLPAGMYISSSTGVISGEVASLWKNQNYTVSAQKPDNEGAVTAVINFGISTQAGVPVDNSTENSDLRYPQREVTLIVGQAVTPMTPTYSGPQGLTGFSSYNEGSSPTYGQYGLTFDAATGTIAGTPTSPLNGEEFSISGPNGSNIHANIKITIIEGPPRNINYTNNSASYPVGYAITTNTPTASGGNIASFSVSPALPTGLSLNTTTGEITGTPSAIQSVATYTITATNVAGSGTKQITITVVNSAPANISYVSVSSRYTVGASITANTPILLGGGTPTSYSVSPALPNGLNLNTSTGIITGLPSMMTATASYTVTATNTLGSVNKVIGINVVNPGSHVLYQAWNGALKAYSVDDVTGEPVFIGHQIGSGVSSKLLFHPSSDCAFGYDGGSVSSFAIDKNDHGKLTAVNSVGGLNGPKNMVMSDSGQFLFVVNNGNPTPQFVRKIEVNPSDCSLSNGSTFSVEYSTTHTARDIAISSDNLYVNYGSGKIRHLKYDNAGAISVIGDYEGLANLYLTAKANGSHLYGTTADAAIRIISVAGNGALTVDSIYNDNSTILATDVPPIMDAVSNRYISAIRNGSNQYGLYDMRLANDGTVDQAGKIEGHSVLQDYSRWSSVSVHTSLSGTYVYSSFTYGIHLGGGPGAARLKIDSSNGAFISQGIGLLGNISGY